MGENTCIVIDWPYCNSIWDSTFFILLRKAIGRPNSFAEARNTEKECVAYAKEVRYKQKSLQNFQKRLLLLPVY